VGRRPPDAGPPLLDARSKADKPLDERIEARLYELGRFLDGGRFRRERRVALAAEYESPVGELLPVVVTEACVVRTLVEALCERLGREDLPTRGDDCTRELGQQRRGEAVARDDDH